ncbi:MAG: kelch repeat-containing protein [Spirosomataceae bacterium]
MKYSLTLGLVSLSLITTAQPNIHWSVLTQMPVADGAIQQVGLAGASSGVHNGVLLIAGGANFEEQLPWEGGVKKYFDDVYVLYQIEKDTFRWAKKTYKLSQKVAYAATVSTSYGVLCVGGENEKKLSDDVFLLQWDAQNQQINQMSLASLPQPLSNASATVVGAYVYVMGGETKNETLTSFYRLNLSSKTALWEKLPNIPIALSHAVAVTQSNGQYPCIYLFGGRAKTESGISKLYNSTFCFDINKNRWKKKKNISHKNRALPALSAGSGVSLGDFQVLLIGGDKGMVFTQIETYNANIAAESDGAIKERLQAQKVALLENHQGFSKDMYLYNTFKNTWLRLGEVPLMMPVTTTAIKWGDAIFISSGEIKPGIRTPNIIIGKLSK